MANTREATHYMHIDGISEEFEEEARRDDTVTFHEYWQLKLLLAIAQQLSLVAHRLKKTDD